MRKVSVYSLVLALSWFVAGVSDSVAKVHGTDYTQWVNPFIGCAYNGHTFPGPCRPFGMVQASPVTGAVGWEYCSEYVYSDSVIWGFSQTHLNGTGCTDLGDILVMPVTGKSHRKWNEYRSGFNKEEEEARVGYYRVKLDDASVTTEVTADVHTAVYRFTYHNADSAALLVDLQHGPSWNEEQYHSQVLMCETAWEDEQTLTGHVRNRVWVSQDYYFVMRFDKPVSKVVNLPMEQGERGQRMIVSFDIEPGEKLMMKVALSTTGVEGARKNMDAEVADWDFDGERAEACAEWNKYLERIDVTGTDEEKTNFYTSMYHVLIQPNQISDVDGLYRNAADSVVMAGSGVFYSTFSLWDTYRAAHSLYTLIVPERVDGFINSLIEQAEVQGFLPIWGLWGKETYCMIANHGVSVVAEALLKGFTGFDAERAYEAAKKTQTVSHAAKSRWDVYERYGYFPADIIKTESVSSTLESVYDDYAVAEMAKALGKIEDEAYFRNRANYYKNLFDEGTGFMRPRYSDGSWKAPFDPSSVGHAESVGGDYTEGNAWQYTWHVQHDVEGLIELFGGPEKFVSKLDSVFTLELETSEADVTGLIGQYAHGNEPSHHIAYLYAMAGYPVRTQELIRQIFDTQYHPEPDGLCGNDDCGQMSAWYIFSAMGFYPVSPVSCRYVLGAPQMSRFEVSLPGGKKLTVVAEGLSTDDKYVESVTFNGEPYTLNYITHSMLLEGGTLVFYMRP